MPGYEFELTTCRDMRWLYIAKSHTFGHKPVLHPHALFNSCLLLAAMWEKIVEKLLEKLWVSDLDDHVKEKIRTVLGKIQARIDEIQKSHEETKEKYPFALAEKYSLIEDIKVDNVCYNIL